MLLVHGIVFYGENSWLRLPSCVSMWIVSAYIHIILQSLCQLIEVCIVHHESPELQLQCESVATNDSVRPRGLQWNQLWHPPRLQAELPCLRWGWTDVTCSQPQNSGPTGVGLWSGDYVLRLTYLFERYKLDITKRYHVTREISPDWYSWGYRQSIRWGMALRNIIIYSSSDSYVIAVDKFCHQMFSDGIWLKYPLTILFAN